MVEYPVINELPDKTNQRRKIQTCLQDAMIPGETWFLIDAKWFKRFKSYVGLDSHRRVAAADPGPIDNSLLLDEDGELKPDLVEDLDYVTISPTTYKLLTAWYGEKDDRTMIGREVISIVKTTKTVQTRIEVYKVCLKMYRSSNFDDELIFYFSKADTVQKIEDVGRALFDIPRQAKVKIHGYYGPKRSTVLAKDKTIFEEGLDSDFKIVFESSVEDNNGTTNETSSVEYRNGTTNMESSVEDTKNDTTNNFITPLKLRRRFRTKMDAQEAKTYSNTNFNFPEPIVLPKPAVTVASAHFPAVRNTPTIPGLCGLKNLGHTCYMASIIQCLSNLKPITQYFLDKIYLNELNESNFLGCKGMIARSYADLLSTMWSGHHVFASPQIFRAQLIKFAPQFAGVLQHDAQELLTFLLDGLHEDLNRCKPEKNANYTNEDENVDDDILAQRTWDSFHKRNDSIIVDKFYGLLRSRVVCPDCEKVSVKFDTFSTLSLPLPIQCGSKMKVKLVPWEQSLSIRDITFQGPDKGSINDIAITLNHLTNSSVDHMSFAEIHKSHFHKFFSKDDPIDSIEDWDNFYVYMMPDEMVKRKDMYTLVPVVMSQPTHYQPRRAFGTPFLLPLPKGPMPYDDLYRQICDRLVRCWNNYFTRNEPETETIFELTMDIDKDIEDDDDEKLFELWLLTPNSENLQDLRGYPIDEEEDFEVPDIIGRAVIGVQFIPHAKADYYRDPSIDKEVFTNLNIGRNFTLEDCLTIFTTAEKLAENNAWLCPRCNEKKRATKKLDLWKLPEILIVHLKRFSYTATRKEKLKTKIEFPLTGLNIDEYVIKNDKDNLVYDLVGVSNHFEYPGGGGHYTATCKSFYTGKWHYFDDKSATLTVPESAQTANAYVLFYQRRPDETVQTNGKHEMDM